MATPKENANPRIHAVRKRKPRTLVASEGAGVKDIENLFSSEGGIPAVRLALAAAEKAAAADDRGNMLAAGSGLGVGLLRDAGFALPGVSGEGGSPLMEELSLPKFAPSLLPEVGDDEVAGMDVDAKDSSSSNTDAGKDEASGARQSIGSASEVERRDPIDADEVFDMIRSIQDPEHPLTLEQLNVVQADHIVVNDGIACAPTDGSKQKSTVDVRITPTIPHCSMATLIGLTIRVKLLRSLPKRFKVKVRINPGTHASEKSVNKQLDDKERVRAALENSHLRGVVDKCIAEGMRSAGGR